MGADYGPQAKKQCLPFYHESQPGYNFAELYRTRFVTPYCTVTNCRVVLVYVAVRLYM